MCAGFLKIIKGREQSRKPIVAFSLALAVSLADRELPALPGADTERPKLALLRVFRLAKKHVRYEIGHSGHVERNCLAKNRRKLDFL